MSRILSLISTLGLIAAIVAGVTVVSTAIAHESAMAALNQQAADAIASGEVTPQPRPIRPSPQPTVEPSEPAEVYDGPLIAPRGFLERTDEEIRTGLTEQAPLDVPQPQVDIAIAQAIIVRDCMAAAGFLYDPLAPGGSWIVDLTTEQQAAYRLAYGGENDDFPYNWRDAGCQGRAVHETGQDDAH